MDNIEKQLREKAELGLSRTQIAAEMGRSKGWLTKKLSMYGISTHCKSGPKRTKDKEYFCKFCGLAIKKNANKYCSYKCQHDYDWQQRKLEILKEGEVKTPVLAKRYIAETQGYKCVECGICEWKKQQLSLILDHINGNPEDWSLINLRLLCPNCDSLTPTFKNRNKGNGRYSRRQRYKEGKSY